MFLPRAHPLDVIADTAISRVSLTSDNRVMVAAMLLLPAFSLAKVLVKYCHKDGRHWFSVMGTFWPLEIITYAI